MTGGMVALVPDQAATLARPGGDPPEELHLTLAYVAEDAAAMTADARNAVTLGALGVSREAPGPVEVVVIGYGSFGMADPPATVLFVEGDGLAWSYDRVRQEMDDLGAEFFPPEHDAFVPHVTLGYGLPLEEAAPLVGQTITFSTVAVVLGGDRSTLPIGAPDDAAVPHATEAAMTVTDTVPTLSPGQPVTVEGLEGVHVVGAVDPATDVVGVLERQAGMFTGRLLHGPAAKVTTVSQADVSATMVALTQVASSCSFDQAVLPRPEPAGERVEASILEGPSMFVVAEDGQWEGLLVPEGVPSGDGRMIRPGALSAAALPMPLMAMFENPVGGDGHDGAQIAGSIDWCEKRGDAWWGGGRVDLDGEAGRELARLVGKRFLRGVSVDLDMVQAGFENQPPPDMDIADMLEFDPGLLVVEVGRISGATACTFPAFHESFIALVTEEAEVALAAAGGAERTTVKVFTRFADGDGAYSLVAAAGVAPVAPPAAWFDPPTEDELVALRLAGRVTKVEPSGRTYGISALFGSCHIGIGNRCVDVPHSPSNYARFHLGHVLTAEGTDVSTGPLLMDTVHPDLGLLASDAQAFYAHTGSGLADVRMYEVFAGGEEMVVFAGALRPEVTPEQVRTFRGSDTSPDWRQERRGVPIDVEALLLVNTSGFKSPALALAASAGSAGQVPGVTAGRVDLETGELLSLVAGGSPRGCTRARDLTDEVSDLKAQVAAMAAFLRPQRAAAAQDRLAPVVAPTDA